MMDIFIELTATIMQNFLIRAGFISISAKCGINKNIRENFYFLEDIKSMKKAALFKTAFFASK